MIMYNGSNGHTLNNRVLNIWERLKIIYSTENFPEISEIESDTACVNLLEELLAEYEKEQNTRKRINLLKKQIEASIKKITIANSN